MALRKITVGGGWWAQRRDGSWLRWHPGRNDWEPQAAPPPGERTEPPPDPVFAFPVSSGSSGWDLPPPLEWARAWLVGYLSLLLPTLLLLLLAYPLLELASLMLMFLFGESDVPAFIRASAVFLSIYLAFFSTALMLVRRAMAWGWWGVAGWAAAAAIALAGSIMAGRAAGLGADRPLLSQLNRWTLMTMVAVTAFSAMDLWMRPLRGRLRLLRPRVFSD